MVILLCLQNQIMALSFSVYPLECTCMFHAKVCHLHWIPVFYTWMTRAVEWYRWTIITSCWQHHWTDVGLCAGITLIRLPQGFQGRREYAHKIIGNKRKIKLGTWQQKLCFWYFREQGTLKLNPRKILLGTWEQGTPLGSPRWFWFKTVTLKSHDIVMNKV